MASTGWLLLFGATAAPAVAQQAAPADPAFVVTPVAEKIVTSLPATPLYWRVERFADSTTARHDAAPNALFAETPDAVWRFTLASGKRAAAPAGLIAEIGPIPVPRASAYLLRVNRAGGPPGVETPVHTHPGSEAFYVLSGTLCQRTEHGTVRLEAGKAMNGHAPGMTMQLRSCGTAPLDQFVLFVVDARQPFSSPARFAP